MRKGKICKKKICFSPETIRRLSLYLRNLKRLKKKNIETISSDRLTQFLNVTPAQFRKDLSYFGEFGKRGVGYEVDRLIKELEIILGTNRQWKIVLVGVGKLGSALLGFPGFYSFNIKITCAFDQDKEKIGKVQSGVKIEDIKKLKDTIRKENIRIALVCTPPEVAQDISERLVEAGIKGILNFAPIILKTPPGIFVSNVDMACELESLIFFLKTTERVKK
jgi:redox-sensing transcriptional repressor